MIKDCGVQRGEGVLGACDACGSIQAVCDKAKELAGNLEPVANRLTRLVATTRKSNCFVLFMWVHVNMSDLDKTSSLYENLELRGWVCACMCVTVSGWMREGEDKRKVSRERASERETERARERERERERACEYKRHKEKVQTSERERADEGEREGEKEREREREREREEGARERAKEREKKREKERERGGGSKNKN